MVPAAKDALIEDLERRGAASRDRIAQFLAGSEPLQALLGQDWARPVRAVRGKPPKTMAVSVEVQPRVAEQPKVEDHQEDVSAASSGV